MTEKEKNIISKYLSLVLRHDPKRIGLSMDKEGWFFTSELVEKIKKEDFYLSLNDLKLIVDENKKKRFSFSEDLSKIRANQGHSLGVNLNFKKKAPPFFLFHGTSIKNLDSIKELGILKKSRDFVHLSSDAISAKDIGMRHGSPVVLKIDTSTMYEKGYFFYLSENKVWLTDFIPPVYIEF